jgi:ABC-type transporter Mla subunit MlaD
MAHSEGGGAAADAEAGLESLKDSASQIADQQKESSARQLSGIAGAVHAAADQLEDQLPGAATYIHDAAERIDRAATDLRHRNLSDIADSVRQLGQERPLVLFGGALLAGFVMTRFLKSGRDSDAPGDARDRASERT